MVLKKILVIPAALLAVDLNPLTYTHHPPSEALRLTILYYFESCPLNLAPATPPFFEPKNVVTAARKK